MCVFVCVYDRWSIQGASLPLYEYYCRQDVKFKIIIERVYEWFKDPQYIRCFSTT